MSREYAQTKVSIWDDDGDFVQRSPHAKLLYMHLYSRRDLTHAGLLFVRERRWADACFNGDTDAVETAMAELVKHRYVITDTKTGELFIRTFIRHDGGWRNPKMRKAIEGSIGKVESVKLSTLATEALARCVAGEPDPASSLVEGQCDYQSDYQSERQPDHISDSTYHLSPTPAPVTVHLEPTKSSSSSSELHAPVDNVEEDEDRKLIDDAMDVVVMRLVRKADPQDAFRYEQTIRKDADHRRDHLATLHKRNPHFTAQHLADQHLGRDARFIEAEIYAQNNPVPMEEPRPAYEPEPYIEPAKCPGCKYPQTFIDLRGCMFKRKPGHDEPANCFQKPATVTPIRQEPA